MSESTPPTPTTPATPSAAVTPSPAAPTASAPASANITFDQFGKIELRIGTVRSAELHPNADKLLKIQLDDGTPAGRQVCAGIRTWYDPATLVGRQVVFVANLEPRTIRGEISQGMILVANEVKDGATDRVPVLLSVERPVGSGSKIS